MPGISSSTSRILTGLALLPIVFYLTGCEFLIFGPDEEASLNVEYRVSAADQSSATHAYGIFYVDEQGQEVTLTDVPLPWSYRGEFEAEARIAAAIAQRGTHSRNGKIKLRVYRDGEFSVEFEAEAEGGSTNVVGYDSDPDAEHWTGP